VDGGAEEEPGEGGGEPDGGEGEDAEEHGSRIAGTGRFVKYFVL
jgi:hypothetical protein